MWNDIEASYDLSVSNYYLGAMIFAGENGAQPAVNPYLLVVDGQQRIATLLLLLAALRDSMFALGNEPPDEGVLDQLRRVLWDYGPGNIKRPRLDLLEGDQKPFKDLILNRQQVCPLTAIQCSNKNVRDTYNFFRRKLDARAVKQGSGFLESFFLASKSMLRIVRVEAPTFLDACVVFESVNDRGLPLTTAERVKSYLFSRSRSNNAGVDVQPEVKSAWADVERQIKSTKQTVDSFLLHFWNSNHYPRVQMKQLYRQFKEEVRQKDVVSQTERLKAEAEIYSRLLIPTVAYWQSSEIASLLSDLGTLGVKLVYTPLMSFATQYKDKRLTEKEFIRILSLLVDFTFRFSTVCSRRASAFETDYCRIAKTARTDTSAAIESLKSLVANLNPSPEEFTGALTTGRKVLPTAR